MQDLSEILPYLINVVFSIKGKKYQLLWSYTKRDADFIYCPMKRCDLEDWRLADDLCYLCPHPLVKNKQPHLFVPFLRRKKGEQAENRTGHSFENKKLLMVIFKLTEPGADPGFSRRVKGEPCPKSKKKKLPKTA